MNKIQLFLFALLFSFNSISQTTTQSNLITYGQVWGFLKYFHPKPSKMDWDQVLIKDYDQLKSCGSQDQFDQILDDLISTCGDYKPKKRNIEEYLLFTESMEWLENSSISIRHREELNRLFKNKPKFKNAYISKGVFSDNPKLKNEINYPEGHKTEAIRYLVITRYWNIINYFCPNRTIIPQNWNEVYAEQLPRFIAAETAQSLELSIRYLSSTIKDGHGFLGNKSGSAIDYNYLPFYCSNLAEGTFIDYVKSDSLKNYSIQRLDKIVSIDGLSIENYWTELSKRLAASNDYYAQNSTFYFRQTLKDSVTITVERDGTLITETLHATKEIGLFPKGAVFQNKRKTGFYIDSISNISFGYIDMGKFKRKNITKRFKDSLKQVDHLIIDSRNYPNWTIFALGRTLIKEKTVFAQFRKMNLDFPSAYVYEEARKIGGARKGYEGKVYILVDYMTMSQAEYTVMGLQQHPNALTIGGQTAGADGDVSPIPMANGNIVFFSGLGVLYPNGTDAQQAGVKRDIELARSFEDLKNLKDHTFQATMELIRESKE